MKEVKKNMSKWMYWFLLGLAIIVVYKVLDNFASIGNAIGNFFSVITPFLSGLLLAYLLYIPASRIEKTFKRSKVFKKRARGISVILTYILAILLIILVINVILPVITDSIIELVGNFQGYWNSAIERLNALPEDSFLKSEVVTGAVKSVGEAIQGINFMEFMKIWQLLRCRQI